MYARALVIVGAIVALLLPTFASAEDEVETPVLRAMSPAETLPPDGIFEVLGVRLGMTIAEAKAVLERINTGAAIDEDTSIISISGGSNHFRFVYIKALATNFRQPGGISESLRVGFSTNINEARVTRITRRVSYNTQIQQVSLPELKAGLEHKYGPASVMSEVGVTTDMFWIWFNGRRVPPSETEVTRGTQGAAVCKSLSFYAYSFNQFTRAAGCGPMMRVRTSPGTRQDLLGSFEIELYDPVRADKNTSDTDAWARAELQKRIDAKRGVAPKL